MTAWQAEGSLKLKTLLHGTSVLPQTGTAIWPDSRCCGDERQEDLASDRKCKKGQRNQGGLKSQLYLAFAIASDQRTKI
jgi:hypothetical protein